MKGKSLKKKFISLWLLMRRFDIEEKFESDLFPDLEETETRYQWKAS